MTGARGTARDGCVRWPDALCARAPRPPARLGVQRARPWAAVIALALVAVFVTPAAAGVDVWTTGDQPGGDISSLALDGATALGGNDSGLYRSSDGGASWTRVGAFDYRSVAAVAIDPAARPPLYAATSTGT